MRINHNISALITQNSLNSANNALGDSLHKLSTGLRINRASDDAAGLSVSEQLRTQVRGNNRARHNAEDGVALLQVAEGAMNEAHSILQRQRELSIQASNDTLTDADRAYLQQEFTALSDELTRIHESTQYNGIDILSGGAENADDLKTMLETDWIPSAIVSVTALYSNLTPPGGNLHITGEKMDGEAGTIATGGSDGTQAVINVDLDDFNSAVTDAAVSGADVDGTMNHLSAGFTAQEILLHEMTHALQFSLGLSTPTWFSEGAAEASNDGGNKRVANLVSGGTTIDNIITNASFTSGASVSDSTWVGNDTDYAAAYLIASSLGAGGIDNVFGSMLGGDTFQQAVATEFGGTYAAFMASVTGGGLANPAGPGETDSSADITTLGFDSVTWDIGEALQMQIGANAQEDVDTMDLDGLGSISADALGVASLSVAEQSGANGAISEVGEAISTVSTKRSDVGAHINRLEHTIQNLHNQEFNQQDAESRIRDVDFAQESTQFTKQQILTQSATSMLAQANGTTNLALSLIG